MPRVEGRDQLRQQVRHGAGGAGQAHAADLALAVALDGLDRVVGLAQQAARAGHEIGAGGRGRHAARAAQQQRGVEPALELAHVQAHRRLREMQRTAGRREGAEVGDGHQRAQLVEVQFSHQVS